MALSTLQTIFRDAFPVCLHARSGSILSHGQQRSRKRGGHAPAAQARPPEKRHTSGGEAAQASGEEQPS
jgi:hypothetical protein